MIKKTMAFLATVAATSAYAGETPITGTVESKCSIFTDKSGVYGAPLPNTLSTAPVDGGVVPRIRFDVAKAGYYTAKVEYPTSFTSSPALSDTVAWTGSVEVSEVTDPAMSAFETNKIEYGSVTEFDLSVAGTFWLDAMSKAEYGVDKSFPAGSYTAVVVAECIAK